MKLWIEYVSALSSSLLGDKWDPPFQRRKEKEMILGVFYLSGPYVPLSGWLHRRNGAACFFHCLDHQPRAHFGLLGSFSVPLQLDHPGSPARLLLASPDPSRSWLRRRRETATHAQCEKRPALIGKEASDDDSTKCWTAFIWSTRPNWKNQFVKYIFSFENEFRMIEFL